MDVRHRLITAAAVVPLALALVGAAPAREAVLAFTVVSQGTAGDYSAGDGLCQSTVAEPAPVHPGPCTLRAALDEATAEKTGVRVTFDIPQPHPVLIGTYTAPEGSTIDGTTQPGYAPGAPIIQIRGLILNGSSVVRGLIITGAGVTAYGNDNTIAGNFIGVGPDGDHVFGVDNTWGIRISGDENTVGGTEEGDRNVIAGWSIGIYVPARLDPSAGSGLHRPTKNTIEGNLIGLDADGKKALGNDAGIALVGADRTLIGGTSNAARNVIAGVHLNKSSGDFTYGITVSSSNGTRIQGNYIGTNETGTAALPNHGGGISIEGKSAVTTIGELIPGPHTSCEAPCNLISGSTVVGISVSTSENRGPIETDISGNFIGTDVTGMHAVPNGIGIDNTASATVIGGTETRDRVCNHRCNLISGNRKDGIRMYGSGSERNIVAGNFIGTDRTGEHALPNKGAGVEINLSSVTVGGTAVPNFDQQCEKACNVISGNGVGVSVGITTHATVKIQGNAIGLDPHGNPKPGLGNFTGIAATNSSGVIVGGTHGEGNLISNNESEGVNLTGTKDVQLLGNWIGVGGSGEPAGNRRGVHIGELAKINGGSIGNVVGSSKGGDLELGCKGGCNLISSNDEGGLWIDGSDSNRVQGNYIGVDRHGTAAAPNGKFGVLVSSVDPNTPPDKQSARALETTRNVIGGSRDDGNLISGNKGDGVELYDVQTSGGFGGIAGNNFVQGNLIGTDRTGEKAIPNTIGVEISAGFNNRVGGPGKDQRNVVSGNLTVGIAVDGQLNKVQRNIVGLTLKGDQALTNHNHQIFLSLGEHNTISKNTILGPDATAVTVAPAARHGNDYSDNTVVTR